MLELPISGELCEFMTHDLGTIIGHETIRYTVSAKLLSEKLDYSSRSGVWQLANFDKV